MDSFPIGIDVGHLWAKHMDALQEVAQLKHDLEASRRERDHESERAGNIVKQYEEIRQTHNEEWKNWHDMMTVLEKERDSARSESRALRAERDEALALVLKLQAHMNEGCRP